MILPGLVATHANLFLPTPSVKKYKSVQITTLVIYKRSYISLQWESLPIAISAYLVIDGARQVQ